jgi:hypothetical protein
MSPGGLIQVMNETVATAARVTRGGRRLTYKLEVIQQPERARACGSGAKCEIFVRLSSTRLTATASADRRPVDPPPIVRLRIFEGQNAENDITVGYPGYFFLYATLEYARHLATGRNQQPPAIPVLTGSPVVGMSYLDRPEPAGYFVFPDLSIRHEGKYRLTFSLYEDVKDPADQDTETDGKPTGPHICHRLEVKTMPFSVFSAKKFPGLAESTSLSKIFAEQGCRVRIRRDVRMRRRNTEGKPGRDFDRDDDYDRGRMSATPDPYAGQPVATPQAHFDHDQSRPVSHSGPSYAQPHMRRSSQEQLAQHYHSQPPSPQTAQNNQWHAPGTPQQPYVARPGSFQPPAYPQQAPSYPAQSYPYENGHGRQNSSDQAPPPPQQPRSHTAQSPVASPRFHHAVPFQAASGPFQPPPQPASVILPKIETLQKIEPAKTYPTAMDLSQPSSTFYEAEPEPQPVAGSKRPYSQSFDTKPQEGPLRDGARPTSSSYKSPFTDGIEASDDFKVEDMMLSYRRADGTQRRRDIPLPL